MEARSLVWDAFVTVPSIGQSKSCGQAQTQVLEKQSSSYEELQSYVAYCAETLAIFVDYHNIIRIHSKEVVGNT